MEAKLGRPGSSSRATHGAHLGTVPILVKLRAPSPPRPLCGCGTTSTAITQPPSAGGVGSGPGFGVGEGDGGNSGVGFPGTNCCLLPRSQTKGRTERNKRRRIYLGSDRAAQRSSARGRGVVLEMFALVKKGRALHSENADKEHSGHLPPLQGWPKAQMFSVGSQVAQRLEASTGGTETPCSPVPPHPEGPTAMDARTPCQKSSILLLQSQPSCRRILQKGKQGTKCSSVIQTGLQRQKKQRLTTKHSSAWHEDGRE